MSAPECNCEIQLALLAYALDQTRTLDQNPFVTGLEELFQAQHDRIASYHDGIHLHPTSPTGITPLPIEERINSHA